MRSGWYQSDDAETDDLGAPSRKGRFSKHAFAYLREDDVYIRPAGERLK